MVAMQLQLPPDRSVHDAVLHAHDHPADEARVTPEVGRHFAAQHAAERGLDPGDQVPARIAVAVAGRSLGADELQREPAGGEAPGQAWAYNDYAIQLYSVLLFDGVFGAGVHLEAGSGAEDLGDGAAVVGVRPIGQPHPLLGDEPPDRRQRHVQRLFGKQIKAWVGDTIAWDDLAKIDDDLTFVAARMRER